MTITLTREEAQQVLDAFESATPKYTRARKDGKTLGGALDYWKLEQHKRMPALKILRARLSAPEPEPVRLRRGDILRCIETNELCTVWATSTTGKTQVKWKANDFGSYTAEQIGDLFWVEPKPECVCGEPNTAGVHRQDGPCYQQPEREWQGLTDEERYLGDARSEEETEYARAIEAKLKEKNT
jgi:hypothetical protein